MATVTSDEKIRIRLPIHFKGEAVPDEMQVYVKPVVGALVEVHGRQAQRLARLGPGAEAQREAFGGGKILGPGKEGQDQAVTHQHDGGQAAGEGQTGETGFNHRRPR